jgi:hypothetical protein
LHPLFLGFLDFQLNLLLLLHHPVTQVTQLDQPHQWHQWHQQYLGYQVHRSLQLHPVILPQEHQLDQLLRLILVYQEFLVYLIQWLL